jgi:CCR4-NOT transcription complex subunit 1
VKWCALLRVQDEKWCDRIIDICESVLPENSLGTFLDVSLSTKTESGYEFAIQLAATASKKDMLSMESWTSNELRVQDHLFVRTLISFLENNRSSSSSGEAKRTTLVLLISIMDILFRDVDLLNTVNRQALDEVHKRYQSDFPNDSRLRNLVDESTHLSVRANNYDQVTTGILENVFSKKCSVKAVIQQVKTWQDQDLLGVLIYNLIDEWRFFESYPADQLEVAAELYGTFITEGIFKEHSLVVALVIILKSFDGSEKLINFGVKALRISQDTLISYPDYCRQLLRTHGLQQRTPDLLDFLEQKVVRLINIPGPHMNNESATTATVAPAEQASQLKDVISIKPVTLGAETTHSTSNRKASGFGVQFNLDTLLEKQKNSVIPSDDVRDEIHLLINNLVADNVEEKVKDLKEKIEPKYYPYFAQYLVTQRVSIELNQQETYRDLVKAFNDPDLQEEVYKATYMNIQILLESDKILHSSSERTLLRNLGKWLGMLTIQQYKPILRRRLDIKKLVLEKSLKKQMLFKAMLIYS